MSLSTILRSRTSLPAARTSLCNQLETVWRSYATDDQGGKAAQTKPDDPNTVAPKGSQNAPSGGDVKSGHSKPPSDEEVDKVGKEQGRNDADKGDANVHEGGTPKNEAADDPGSDTAQKFTEVSNTERDAASTA